MISRTFEQSLYWFVRRPAVSFAMQLAILAPLALADDGGRAAAIYGFAAPWLLPAFGILNLPVLGAAFRVFRSTPALRRNHALEHATIRVLESTLNRRLAGKAADGGFHVYGPVSADDIREAFDRVRRAIEDGRPIAHVSPRCGSTVVSALALGLVLLWLAVLACLILRPAYAVRVAVLSAVVILFLSLRRTVGLWLQRRVFMRDDFVSVRLRTIRRARASPMHPGAAHFVETSIGLAPDRGMRSRRQGAG